jgi:hypothetical protein
MDVPRVRVFVGARHRSGLRITIRNYKNVTFYSFIEPSSGRGFACPDLSRWTGRKKRTQHGKSPHTGVSGRRLIAID